MIRPLIAMSMTSLLIWATPALGQAPALFVDSRSTTANAAERLEEQDREVALRLSKIPSASWLAYGSPEVVQEKARDIVGRASVQEHIPVLAIYNIPYRDCALYSAGGAADSGAYREWILGVARAIGDRAAIVILEPDGLGVIPWHRTLAGEIEGCGPEGKDEGAAARRYEELRSAVAILSALPGVSIYLDGTGSSWLAPGEIASRLIRADVAKVSGFFLNVSNFHAAIAVIGIWATLSGILQLSTAARRWQSAAAQWPMILSGAQSALAGLFFIAKSNDSASSPNVADVAPYAAFGSFYFAVAAFMLFREAGVRKRMSDDADRERA